MTPAFKIYRKRWRRENPDKVKMQNERNKNNRRNSQYKYAFGISLADYNRLFADQNGRCAICEKHQTEFSKNLAVDHDHKTGKVRGLLCTACNYRLGNFEDALFCTKATEYLRKIKSAV